MTLDSHAAFNREVSNSLSSYDAQKYQIFEGMEKLRAFYAVKFEQNNHVSCFDTNALVYENSVISYILTKCQNLNTLSLKC